MSEQQPPEQTVDQSPSEGLLDAGLAAAFAPDSGPPIPAGASVLKALGAALPEVPHVVLREPDSENRSPIVRPSSEEMPPRQDPASRIQLFGEIARGGMGAILKGRSAQRLRGFARPRRIGKECSNSPLERRLSATWCASTFSKRRRSISRFGLPP